MARVQVYVKGQAKPITVDFGDGPVDQEALADALASKFKPDSSAVFEKESEKTRQALDSMALRVEKAVSSINFQPVFTQPEINLTAPHVNVPPIEFPEFPAPVVNVSTPQSEKKVRINCHSVKYDRKGNINGLQMDMEVK